MRQLISIALICGLASCTPAQHAEEGRWGPVFQLPTHPEQMAVVRSGKVLMWPWAPERKMDGTLFPVERELLPCALSFLSESEFDRRTREIAEVTRLSVKHPGGADGIRVRCDGRTVVYIRDNELDPPYESTARFDEIVASCRDADVLIHDARYLYEDKPAKRGWGTASSAGSASWRRTQV